RWLLAVLLFSSTAFAGRFALVVGENRGLHDEELLRFATTDARKVEQALLDVGGFVSDQIVSVEGADANRLRAALVELKARMGEGPHERLVIYVSSHAADGSLHLDGTAFPMQELIDFLKAAPVDVGLLVIDACQSGRVTQLKGVKATAAPKIEATRLEGRVLISASGADEYAQESDALQGSYFTHYFVTGLRGAADSNGDGSVTLDEVYAWAWARTIEATFSSRGGVQRPAFSVDLRGTGQLELSKPRASSSQLTIDVQTPGRWLVVSQATGNLFADVEKPQGALTLAIPPGTYRVQLRVADGVLERSVVVPPKGAATLSGGDLEKASLLRVARKGGEETRVTISAGGSITSGLVNGLTVQPGAELRFRRDGHLFRAINQFTANVGYRHGASITGAFLQNELEARLGLGHRFVFSPVSIAVGLELGALLVLQHALPNDSSRVSFGGVATLGLEGRVVIAGPLEAFLLLNAGGALVKKLPGITAVPRLSATLGLAVTF
ncbi:MAG: caspase family protein, partial [Archangium sp.]